MAVFYAHGAVSFYMPIPAYMQGGTFKTIRLLFVQDDPAAIC